MDQKVVDFDIIESFHEFEEDIFVCPKGKYSPLTIKFREFKRDYNNILDKIEDWELKCINYNQKYFMIFYLTKEKYHIFNKKSGTEWQYTEINQEINAIQLLNNRISNNDYPTIYIIKDSGALKIKVVSHKIAGNSDTNFLSEFDSCIAKHITNAGNNTRICFENNNELFYFLTYTNASDFSCGYFDYNENIDFTAFEGNLVNINTESPLEFFDETKIEYIKFIYNYKYAYYKINNLNNGKNFYGIIDTKKNLVVFNTEEDIITYVPYSNISMLAITSTTAYEICVIKENGFCIDPSECSDENYILDIEGNKCANSCDGGKIFLIRENICNNTCDEFIYVRDNDKCGLCKDFNSSNPYKLINTPGCLNSTPYGAEVYNNKLNLLECKSGYKLVNDKCIIIKKTYEQTSSEEFKEQLLNNITAFVNSSEFINGSDFLAVVLSSDDMDPKEQLKKGISAIDLGNCTEQIKEHYNIPKNESLIILNLEKKRNETKINEEKSTNDKSIDVGKSTQIEIYDYSGRRLNLSVCKEDIIIMKYIGDLTEELDIDTAMAMAESGVDVFNASDGFFNDICHEYENNNGVDIIIEDRREDIYKNVSFCDNGCSYKGMNYNLMIANCVCDTSIIENSNENNIETNNDNEDNTFKPITKSVIASLLDFNTDVIYCYNLVFNLKYLKDNIGFYCMIIMLIVQLICFIIYIVKKLKSLKYFMLTFEKENKQYLPQTTNDINNNQNKILNNNAKKDKNKVKNKLVIKEDEINSKSNSKKIIDFMEDENDKNLGIIEHNNILKMNENNEEKNNVKNLIFYNNLAKKNKFQEPIINILDMTQKIIPNRKKEDRKSKIPKEKYKKEPYKNKNKINNNPNNNNDKPYSLKSKIQKKLEKNKDNDIKNNISNENNYIKRNKMAKRRRATRY